jgi:hypothetical protein
VIVSLHVKQRCACQALCSGPSLCKASSISTFVQPLRKLRRQTSELPLSQTCVLDGCCSGSAAGGHINTSLKKLILNANSESSPSLASLPASPYIPRPPSTPRSLLQIRSEQSYVRSTSLTSGSTYMYLALPKTNLRPHDSVKPSLRTRNLRNYSSASLRHHRSPPR